MSSINPGTIDNAARGDSEAMRTVLNAIMAQLNIPGQPSLLEPTSGGKTLKPVVSTPAAASLTVSGANGLFQISITNPVQTVPGTIFHEVSYSPSSNFAGAVSLPVTSATSIPVSMPGQTLYWRIRSSFDQANFNAYAPAKGNAATAAGLQSSAATADAAVLNQTNYANIDSIDGGTIANIRIYGKAGPGFMYPAVKGSSETILPSATIVNVLYGSTKIVGYSGKYSAQPTLPMLLADGVTPTGAVSVVGSGAVVLPTVALVLDGSGHVIAWNVLTQGNGLTAAVGLVINTSTGTGATPGAQTISAGKLISIGPGNPGVNYSGGDTVTVSGGVSSGAAGGGQSIGGNNGRFIFNDSTTGA